MCRTVLMRCFLMSFVPAVTWAQLEPSGEQLRTGFACEGSTLTIDCRDMENKKIWIVRANYGRQNVGICNDGRDTSRWNLQCISRGATSRVSQMCNGMDKCSVTASNVHFGANPCPDTVKYLETQYHCVQELLITRTTSLGTTEVNRPSTEVIFSQFPGENHSEGAVLAGLGVGVVIVVVVVVVVVVIVIFVTLLMLKHRRRSVEMRGPGNDSPREDDVISPHPAPLQQQGSVENGAIYATVDENEMETSSQDTPEAGNVGPDASRQNEMSHESLASPADVPFMKPATQHPSYANMEGTRDVGQNPPRRSETNCGYLASIDNSFGSSAAVRFVAPATQHPSYANMEGTPEANNQCSIVKGLVYGNMDETRDDGPDPLRQSDTSREYFALIDDSRGAPAAVRFVVSASQQPLYSNMEGTRETNNQCSIVKGLVYANVKKT